jgi:hypothetical protein
MHAPRYASLIRARHPPGKPGRRRALHESPLPNRNPGHGRGIPGQRRHRQGRDRRPGSHPVQRGTVRCLSCKPIDDLRAAAVGRAPCLKRRWRRRMTGPPRPPGPRIRPCSPCDLRGPAGALRITNPQSPIPQTQNGDPRVAVCVVHW